MLNVTGYSVLSGSASVLILYFYYGEYMLFLFQVMDTTEASRKNLEKYPNFTKLMAQCAEAFPTLPVKEQFNWTV